MSDEQRREDEVEVEGHVVEISVNDEPVDDDVEAHVMRLPNVRME